MQLSVLAGLAIAVSITQLACVQDFEDSINPGIGKIPPAGTRLIQDECVAVQFSERLTEARIEHEVQRFGDDYWIEFPENSIRYPLNDTVCRTKSEEAQIADFEPGAWWHYDTRSGEELSRLLVVHRYVDESVGVVYYTCVDYLEVAPSDSRNWVPFSGAVCPTVSESALLASVTERAGSAPDLLETESELIGLERWLALIKAGEVHIETSSIRSLLDFLDNR